MPVAAERRLKAARRRALVGRRNGFKPEESGGFTLLEVITATLITGLIALAAAGALANITSGWERGEALHAERTAVTVVGDRLRLELASLSRGPFGIEPGFEGESEGFSFCAPAAEGLRRLSVEYADGRVILRIKALRRPPGDDERTVILAEGVSRLACSYYDAAARDWESYWDGAEHQRPPSLVRLEMRLGTQSKEREMPPLIVPVRPGRIISLEGIDRP